MHILYRLENVFYFRIFLQEDYLCSVCMNYETAKSQYFMPYAWSMMTMRYIFQNFVDHWKSIFHNVWVIYSYLCKLNMMPNRREPAVRWIRKSNSRSPAWNLVATTGYTYTISMFNEIRREAAYRHYPYRRRDKTTRRNNIRTHLYDAL